MLVKHLKRQDTNKILEFELFKRKKKNVKGFLVIFMMDLHKCWRMCLLRSGLIEKTYAEKGPEPAFNELADLKEMVRDALYEVRRIIYDLRPMALDDLGTQFRH